MRRGAVEVLVDKKRQAIVFFVVANDVFVVVVVVFVVFVALRCGRHSRDPLRVHLPRRRTFVALRQIIGREDIIINFACLQEYASTQRKCVGTTRSLSLCGKERALGAYNYYVRL